MKKVLSVLMVVAAMMFATNANAQIKFGLKGGLDVTNMSLSNDVFDASNKTGFFVGPMVKVTIPVVGLSFDAAALYDQKEAKVSAENVETTMTQKSLNIPVNVRYGFGLSSLANVFVFAGPQWGINVGAKNFKWDDAGCYSLKKSRNRRSGSASKPAKTSTVKKHRSGGSNVSSGGSARVTVRRERH